MDCAHIRVNVSTFNLGWFTYVKSIPTKQLNDSRNGNKYRLRSVAEGQNLMWIPTFEPWLLINDSWEWPCCLTFTVGSLLFIHCWHIGNYGQNISSFATKDLTWIYNNLKLKCWCGKGRGGEVKSETQISCATQPVWCNSLRSRCLHISKVTLLLLRHKWPIF